MTPNSDSPLSTDTENLFHDHKQTTKLLLYNVDRMTRVTVVPELIQPVLFHGVKGKCQISQTFLAKAPEFTKDYRYLIYLTKRN